MARPIPSKIEFRCVQCDRLLRVVAEHIGGQIDCPACQVSLLVPDPDAVHHAESPQGNAAFVRIWNPQPASLQSILQDTWTLYVENLWTLLAVTLVDLVMWGIGIILVLVPAVGTLAVLHKAMGGPHPVSAIAMFLILIFGLMTLVNAMTCSHAKFYLKIARGEPTSVLDAFHLGWKRGAITMLPTVFGLLCLSGLLILIVPGVFVYVAFWPYIWAWADRQTGDNDAHAFPLARQLTNCNRRTSIAIGVLGVALSIFGLKLFGRSLHGVMKAVAYLQMSGQEVTGLARHDIYPVIQSEGVDPA